MSLPVILVPDAANRPALTVIRSLGSRGCTVVAGAQRRAALGVVSRYAAQYFRHPSPAEDPAGFVREAAAAARDHGVSAILPAADVPASALLQHKSLLPPEIRLVLPPEQALEEAHDKIRLAELATRCGVPVPRGFTARGDCRGDPGLEGIGYPLVLKPRSSRYVAGGGWHGAAVQIIGDPGQLERALAVFPEFSAMDYLVQEKVPGEGRGVFLLVKDGETRAVFAHRRIREKPPEGGVSTLCETAEPEPELVDYSKRLMSALRWSGVAMVEFKWDPERRRAWLMEINGRFWGSMQLAVASGVDFPWLVYEQEVLGRTTAETFTIGKRRLVWIPGDLDHFLLRLRRRGIGEVGAMLRDWMSTRAGVPLDTDTLRITDPAPFLLEMGQWVFRTCSSIFRGLLPAGRRSR